MIHGGGTAKFPHSHAVTFAFAMSIEESSDPVPYISPLPSNNRANPFIRHGDENPSNQIEEIMQLFHVTTERHSGQIQLLMGESLNYEEVVAIMEQHDKEIMDYFQNLILATQPPLIIPINDILALDKASGACGPVIMEIAD